MNVLWMIKLPLVYNIIHGIAGHGTYKSLKRIKLDVGENECSYESITTRTSSQSPKFAVQFVPRKKRRTFQRKFPQYLNTFAIPASYELPKSNGDKASDSSPSCCKKNGNDVTQNHCVECDVTYRYDKHYVKHCKDVHGTKRPFPCGYCESTFGLRRKLVDHVNEVHGLKNNPYAHWKKSEPIACHECRETLLGWTKFEQHALSKHAGIKMMNCSHCPEKFLTRKKASRHEKLQHETLGVKCGICENIFERSDLLKEHSEFCQQRQIRNKMGDKQVRPIVRYDTLVCEECGDEHKTITHLRDHLRLKHPRVKLHACDHCDAAFSHWKTLEKHVDMVHPDKTGRTKSWKKFKRGAVYACEYCEEIFSGTLEYEKHGKRHPGLPMFRCKDCGKGYATRKSTSNHANEAHGCVKTRCPNCSKCYFRIWAHQRDCKKKMEKRERKRMAGYPKHYCDICSKDFYMKDHSFRNHVNRHKYFDCCAICGQRFRRGKGGLNEHMERRHPLRGNMETLLRTADEGATFVKREKAADAQYTNARTEDFDLLRDFPEVKAESPEFCVKVEGCDSEVSE